MAKKTSKVKEAEIEDVAMTTKILVPKENIEPIKEAVKSETVFVEFLMDANVHWIGKSFVKGSVAELNIEDVEKLKITNHVKVIERKDK